MHSSAAQIRVSNDMNFRIEHSVVSYQRPILPPFIEHFMIFCDSLLSPSFVFGLLLGTRMGFVLPQVLSLLHFF